MKNLVLIAIISLLAFSFQSCEKETLQLTTNKEYPGVDQELWVFFQNFEEASAKRGIPIDLISSGITGSIKNLHIENIVGVCNHDSNNPHHIIIDENYWNASSFFRKELAVFHNLGHCYLKLNHSDAAHPDGRCKSIMNSSSGSCTDLYTSNTRDEYQDELFIK